MNKKILLSNYKYCIDYDPKETDKKEGIKRIGDFYIDITEAKKENDIAFVKREVDDFGELNKIFLWHKYLVNYLITKYEKVIILQTCGEYENNKAFDKPLEFPEDKRVPSSQCNNCMIKADCKEYMESFAGNEKLEIQAQEREKLYNQLVYINGQISLLTSAKDKIKEIITTVMKSIDEFPMERLGIKAVKKPIMKGSISVEVVKEHKLPINDETANIKITKMRKYLNTPKLKKLEIKIKLRDDIDFEQI